ncbi:DUF4350 domain-containing protein [Methanotorris formicicus]|uniref:DUF4350 domain-containing protein n=1 Tax=Methanotorris formicicus Mc-S-70 TaxID=647171 RepID=H1KXE3_9EURY|nr:DUF4350 domain-containing protein [Methanotorris formicicus]EHP88355.1 hypothetical protein MetfoDRAFT_0466 [Methanotorris formicicus Mc-S-70]
MAKYLKYVTFGILGILLLSLPSTLPVIKSFCPYSIFNTDWNGCSKFAKMIHDRGEVVPLISPYDSYNIKNGVLFIISPDIHYSSKDVEKIKTFLENGGTVIIADDFGYGNDILEGLNISPKISKRRAEDLFYYKNYSLIETYRIEDFDGKITFNIPSYISSNNGEIRTSSISKKILMKKVKYANGKVVIISDPDVFINAMETYNKNFWDVFLNNLDGYVYYIDEVHHSKFSPYDIGVVYVQSNLSNNTKFIIFSLIVIGIFIINNIDFSRIIKFKRKTSLEKIAEENNIDINELNRVISKIKEGKNYNDLR